MDDLEASRGLPPALGVAARHALETAGIRTLEDVAGMSEAELRGIPDVGPRALAQLRDALAVRGMTFRSKRGLEI